MDYRLLIWCLSRNHNRNVLLIRYCHARGHIVSVCDLVYDAASATYTSLIFLFFKAKFGYVGRFNQKKIFLASKFHRQTYKLCICNITWWSQHLCVHLAVYTQSGIGYYISSPALLHNAKGRHKFGNPGSWIVFTYCKTKNVKIHMR